MCIVVVCVIISEIVDIYDETKNIINVVGVCFVFCSFFSLIPVRSSIFL